MSNQPTKFEAYYLPLRQKEGRIYSHKEVAQLPYVPDQHPLKKEWDIRRWSCGQLVKYLSKKKQPLSILEMGCGNGWLSHQLSLMSDVQVTGVDINTVELEQAKQVFNRSNLRFINGNISDAFLNEKFDVIVFAASFQYFNPVQDILENCFRLLKQNGEVHIMDTCFYTKEEGVAAKQRSADYFESQGFSEMGAFYFHHCLADLSPYSYKLLFNPKSIIHKIKGRHPFPWICISKSER